MSAVVQRIEQVEVLQPKKVIKKKAVKRKRGLYNFTNLAIVAGIGIFAIVGGQLYLDAQINQMHYQTEALKLKIANQTVVNEELYSKIAELSTYTRAMEIAKENGLSTYENIISIGE